MGPKRFYELDHPSYPTDQARARHNPVECVAGPQVPAVDCPRCGIWASSDSIRVRRKGARLEEFAWVPGLAWEQWKARRQGWARRLGVSREEVRPGARVGPPVGRVRTRRPLPDVVHPFPGRIWVSRKVRDAVVRARLAGLSFEKVRLAPAATHDLWELAPHQTAWRVGVTRERTIACATCGRTRFPRAAMVIDARRWGAFDVAMLDGNPSILVASERAKEVMARFGNLTFTPLRRK